MSTATLRSSPQCSFCQNDRGVHPLFCAACHRLFPEPPSFTHFDRLGLAMTYDLNPAELQDQLLRLTRRFHPDFFATKDPDQQELSLAHSASLNVAYATLQDPFDRAEYLLKLSGGANSSEDKRTPPGFLEEMLSLREVLEESLESKDEETTAALHQKLSARQENLAADLSALFRRLEQSGNRTEVFECIRMTLNAAKYIRGLVRDSSGLRRPAF